MFLFVKLFWGLMFFIKVLFHCTILTPPRCREKQYVLMRLVSMVRLVSHSVLELQNLEENSALFIQCVYRKVRVSLEMIWAERKWVLSTTYNTHTHTQNHKINTWRTWLSVCCSARQSFFFLSLSHSTLHFKYSDLLR